MGAIETGQTGQVTREDDWKERASLHFMRGYHTLCGLDIKLKRLPFHTRSRSHV